MTAPLNRERALIRARLTLGPLARVAYYKYEPEQHRYCVFRHVRSGSPFCEAEAWGSSWDAALADLEAQYPDGRQS